MTVKELIKKLQDLPQDSKIVVQGYEGGLSDIGQIKPSRLELGVNSESWNGPHEESLNGGVPCVLLLRAENPNSD